MSTTKTYSAKPHEIDRKWWIVDADGQTLGRLASNIANLLRGKNKPQYTPHIDSGDFVVVVNAEKIKVTGNKLQQKKYYSHSGFPGGFKEINLADLLAKHPTRVIEKAVKGMLPHTRLGAEQIKKLKVYTGPAHPHAAQQPAEYKLTMEVAQ